MSILNQFMFVFETEGGETVLKDIRRMDAASEKLEGTADKTSKSIAKTGQETQAAGKRAQTTANQFTLLKKEVAGAVAPLLALGVVLHQTLNFAAQGEQLLFMAKSANMAADAFQKLAIANERYGGSREGAAGMMAGLAGQVQALKFGQPAPLQDAAVMYGLNLQGRNGGLAEGNELLHNVAAAMERLDAGAQLDLGRRIGLDEATIRLLQEGVAAFDAELARAANRQVFTPEDLQRARDMERAWRDFKLSVQSVWAEISRWLLPALQNVTEAATAGMDYISEHGDAIKAGLLVITGVLAGAALNSIVALTAATWAWLAPILAVMLPILAIGAALVLLYDDFMTFAEGGQSALEPLWNLLVEIGRYLADDFVNDLKSVWEWLTAWLNPIKLARALLGRLWDAIPEWVKVLVRPDTADDGTVSRGADILAQADQNPLAAVAAGSVGDTINRTSSQNNSYQLTVNGSQNPARDGAQLLGAARSDAFESMVSGQEA